MHYRSKMCGQYDFKDALNSTKNMKQHIWF